jgi:hypothetical protein
MQALTPKPSFLAPAAIICPMISNGTPGPHADSCYKLILEGTDSTNAARTTEIQKQQI